MTFLLPPGIKRLNANFSFFLLVLLSHLYKTKKKYTSISYNISILRNNTFPYHNKTKRNTIKTWSFNSSLKLYALSLSLAAIKSYHSQFFAHSRPTASYNYLSKTAWKSISWWTTNRGKNHWSFVEKKLKK